MTRSRAAFPLVAFLVLAACTSTNDPSQTAEPTATAAPTPTASAEPTAEATDSESAEPSAASSPIGGEPGGFAFASNAEADDLFLDRFTCQNPDAGYEVDFPSEWNANAEFGDTPPCSWFAATEYEGGDGTSVPDEVAIEIWVTEDAPRDYGDAEVSDRQEGFIGVTQSAYRVNVTDDDVDAYEYVVQLGESFDDGPLLVARTTTEMGGDFDLNRAVLDRMMATMEFIGVIQ